MIVNMTVLRLKFLFSSFTLLNNNECLCIFYLFYRRVPDPNKNLGTYAFRLPKDNVKGIWISFEEPETAKQKATYVKQNDLGGIALMDLSLDDARGICSTSKYPILKAVRSVL